MKKDPKYLRGYVDGFRAACILQAGKKQVKNIKKLTKKHARRT